MATLLAEIYGPDAETRRAVAARVEEAFRSADFIVDIDNSWGQPAERARVKISTDNLEFFRVEEQRRVRHDRHPQHRSRRWAIRIAAAAARRSPSGSSGPGRPPD
jgi:hypothetical protein